MTTNFRNIARYLVPAWLSEGEGAAVLATITGLIDASIQHVRDAVDLRFPSRCGDSGLRLHGDMRGIVRGRTEALEHYVERLKAWRYPRGHRVRGNAFAYLEQLSEYWGGLRCWVIDRKGNLREWSAAGVTSYSYGNTWNWDGVAATPRWARFWTVLDVSTEPTIIPWPAVLGAYDNSLLPGRGFTIGQQGVTPEDCKTVKGLLRGRHPWKPAGTQGEWLIVSFDGSAPVPDGTWGKWSGRDASFRYWWLHKPT